MAGIWQVVAPEATTNLCLNPSAEGSGNYAALGVGLTAGPGTASAYRGTLVYAVNTTALTNDGIALTLSALANAAHYVTLRLAATSTVPGGMKWSLNGGANYRTPSLLATEGAWQLWGFAFTAGDANGSTALWVVQASDGAGDWDLDCVQVEQKTYWTTYCDGDQPGCSWVGAPHQSRSTRSAQARSGGRVRDLLADYSCGVEAMEGWGLPEVRASSVEYAQIPGGLVQGQQTGFRQWQLVFGVPSPSLTTVHTLRDYLIELFKPDRVAPAQPVRVRYSGSTSVVEIDAWYVGGLEGSLVGEDGLTEQPVVRLLSEDPYWYRVDGASASASYAATVADYAAAARHGGAWTFLTYAPASTSVDALCLDPSGHLYIGGSYTTAAGALSARITKLPAGSSAGTNPSAVSTGISDGAVTALVSDLAGRVYVGGTFSSAGGVANTESLVRWHPSSSGWQAISSGIGGQVNALALGSDDRIYVGGSFTDVGSVSGDNLVSWGTSSGWIAVGAGLDAEVHALAAGPDGSIYVGGDFTQDGALGVVVRQVGRRLPTGGDLQDLGPVSSGAVYGLAVSPVDGSVYAVGDFLAIGARSTGVTVNYVARLRVAASGAAVWEALGTGLSAPAYAVAVDDAGQVYAAGRSTAAGTGDGRLMVWNGSVWRKVDLELHDLPAPHAIVARGNDLYVGHSGVDANTSTCGANTTVTNAGSATAYPTCVITRTGGSGATIEYLKNETTGDAIYLDYDLMDGEVLTVDLDYRRDPTKPTSKTGGRKRITSSLFGDVIGRALLPGSDLASFGLIPGDNSVTAYASYVDGVVDVKLRWRIPFWSPDGAIS